VIAPEFLAALRRRHRAELVLVLVQLEQVAPGWWLTLTELADQLGTDRATLNRSIRKLEDLGLLRRASISNSGGTWIWWVQRAESDRPRPEEEPAWVLRDISRHRSERVPIGQRWAWAQRQGIPRQTMRSFLAGGQRVLRDRWELVATPLDCYSL
jgi:hypothetical protein